MHRVRSSPAVGNLSTLLDSADGSLDAKYEYGAFGEPLRVAGTSIADDNLFRFSTKYLESDGARKRVDGDAEGVARRAEEAGAPWALMRQSGLVYYGYRYSSPSLGRFLNRDPLVELGGSNLYGFVENDPVNGWDYLGLNDELICDPADYSAGVCDDGGGGYHTSLRERRRGAEGWYFDWDLWMWRSTYRPRFEEGPEYYFDMELAMSDVRGGSCLEGPCPKVPVQQKPQDQAPQDDGPSILELGSGSEQGDRVIDPAGEKPGILERFWNWLNRPPETEFEKAMMDFGAGFGDSMTFGSAKKVRQIIGTDETTNYEGDAYKRGQQAEGYTPRGLGRKLALKLAIKRGANKALTASQKKAIRSLNKQIAEHRNKLKAYKANPDAFDNKGFLRNAKTPEARRKIIEGRIRSLERQISNFEKQTEDII